MHKHSMRRLLSAIAAGGFLLTAPILFTGCADEVEKTIYETKNAVTGGSMESKMEALSSYVLVTNTFNGASVTFDFAQGPTLERMRNGERMTGVSLPDFESLQYNLKNARSNGSVVGVYKDIDEKADEVLAIVNELVPLAKKMEGYYASKTYTTDDYAAGMQMTKEYLALYDKFEAAYAAFDGLVTIKTDELRAEHLTELKKDGKVNAATFVEVDMKIRELVMMLDTAPIDKTAAEAKIAEVTGLMEKLPQVDLLNTYRSKVNELVGEVRSAVAKGENNNSVIGAFNRLVNESNRIDINELD